MNQSSEKLNEINELVVEALVDKLTQYFSGVAFNVSYIKDIPGGLEITSEASMDGPGSSFFRYLPSESRIDVSFPRKEGKLSYLKALLIKEVISHNFNLKRSPDVLYSVFSKLSPRKIDSIEFFNENDAVLVLLASIVSTLTFLEKIDNLTFQIDGLGNSLNCLYKQTPFQVIYNPVETGIVFHFYLAELSSSNYKPTTSFVLPYGSFENFERKFLTSVKAEKLFKIFNAKKPHPLFHQERLQDKMLYQFTRVFSLQPEITAQFLTDVNSFLSSRMNQDIYEIEKTYLRTANTNNSSKINFGNWVFTRNRPKSDRKDVSVFRFNTHTYKTDFPKFDPSLESNEYSIILFLFQQS